MPFLLVEVAVAAVGGTRESGGHAVQLSSSADSSPACPAWTRRPRLSGVSAVVAGPRRDQPVRGHGHLHEETAGASTAPILLLALLVDVAPHLALPVD
jgi:hypothetical protein